MSDDFTNDSEGEPEASDPVEFGMVLPFWIDTDAYTDRDRSMFVCGYEFCQISDHIRNSGDGLGKTIHRENESRIRMACGRFGRKLEIEPCESEHDPDGTWSYLAIAPREEGE